ncbi:MAG: M1 family metallopeptidase [Myxococcales bacterium]|nr:M1 family metallopeptidase [Myxococcales bacterium]
MRRAALCLLLACSGEPVRATSDRGTPPVTTAVPTEAAPTTTPTAGAPLDRPRSIVDYKLTARLDPAAHTIKGAGSLTWTNTSARSVSELYFHLYLNAFKNQRSVFLREPLGPGRGGNAVTDWGAIDVKKLVLREGNVDLWPKAETKRDGDEDETDAKVPLPRAVLPGETITLDMEWEDKLPSVVERTGYHGSFHFAGQWFPKIARLEADGTWAHFPFHRLSEFYADFGSYEVTLDVPEAFVVGATGPKVEERTEGGRRIVKHAQADVHDFAWTAWDRFVVREENIGGVAVRALFPPGYEAVATREVDVMRKTLPHFAERYGPYPYRVLTIVHPPWGAGEAGGMEYPTLITAGGPFWLPEALRATEAVTVHEFGHQYFYGLFASNENLYPFLDEGLNSYAEHEAMGAFFGAGSSFSALGLEINGAAITASFSDDGSLVQPVAIAAPEFVTSRFYGRLVYVRTAAVLETFRRVYGDETMRRFFRDYAQTARFRHPRPDDLFAAVERAFGADGAKSIRTALAEKGWVDYQVLDVATRRSAAPLGMFDRNGKRETVSGGNQTDGFDSTVLVAKKGTLTFPIDIDVIFEGGATERVRWDAQTDTKRFWFKNARPVRMVSMDPERRVLLDRNPRNNFALAPDGKRASAALSFERLLFWAQTFTSLVTP